MASAGSDSQFIEAALAASDDCIKIIGLDGTLQYMTEGGRRVMEIDDFDAVRGCPWPDFWQDQGNIEAIASIEAARAGETTRFTGYANTFKGRRRYWDVKVSPILSKDGRIESILSVSRDITAVREAEERQALLRHELGHRIRNILTMVQAVAIQTLRGDVLLAEAKMAFFDRLAALGRANDLLTRDSSAETSLVHLVTSAIESDRHRISVFGPDLSLGSKAGWHWPWRSTSS